MARAFSVTLVSASVNNARDLILVQAPTGFKMRVLHASVGTVSSETPDEGTFGLYYATDNGTGTATNVVGLDGFSNQTDWAAWGGVALTNLTAPSTKSPADPVVYEAADLAVGWEWDREEDIDWVDVPAGKRIVLRLNTAPASATDLTARLVFEIV